MCCVVVNPKLGNNQKVKPFTMKREREAVIEAAIMLTQEEKANSMIAIVGRKRTMFILNHMRIPN